eukprot:3669932-Prymnesium_polylepis.2
MRAAWCGGRSDGRWTLEPPLATCKFELVWDRMNSSISSLVLLAPPVKRRAWPVGSASRVKNARLAGCTGLLLVSGSSSSGS